jgi:hypothetical protein
MATLEPLGSRIHLGAEAAVTAAGLDVAGVGLNGALMFRGCLRTGF